MTSDFAREFYDLIPPSLGPHPSNSRSFTAMDTAKSSRNLETEASSEIGHSAMHHNLATSILSPKTLSKEGPKASSSLQLSASKKASAARQRYVGLASARSPHASGNRFDLGLDSPGTPPPPQPPSHSHSSPIFTQNSAKAVVKPSSSDGWQAKSRSRLVDLDSRLLQVSLACSF
jgi:hypothetical protein